MALSSTRDIGIRYVVDIVDRGTRKLLAEDRQVRRSMQQTERILRSEGATARQVANATRNLAGEQGRAATAARGRARVVTEEVRAMGRLERATRSATQRLRELATQERLSSRRPTGRVSAGVAAGGVGARIGLPAAAGAAAAGIGGAALLSNVVGFEKSMDRVNALLLTNQRNMARLNKLALELGAKTQFSARQASDAMGELAAAGFSTNQIMRTLPGTLNLAAAAGTDLSFAANTQAAAIRQFGLRAGESAHVADVMTMAVNRSAITIEDLADTLRYVGPVAGRFNQSFEDMSAATAILGNVGIVGSQAGTTLRRALVSVVRPSEKTIKVLNDAGISAREFAKLTVDASGNLRPLPVVLGNLAGKLEGVDKATRRKTIAQLFGTEALPGMITLFDKGEGAISKMSGAFERSGGAAQRTASIMRDNVAGAWENFTGSIETASIAMLRRFTPALKDVLNLASTKVNQGAGTIGGFLTALLGGKSDRPQPRGRTSPLQRERLPTRAVGFRTSPFQREPARAPEPSGAQKAGEAVRGVLSGALDIGKRALPAIIEFGKQMVDAFKPALPLWQNVLGPMVKGFGQAIIETVAIVIKLLPPVVKIVATVAGAIGRFLAPLAPVFKAVGYIAGLVLGPALIKVVGGAVRSFGLLGRIASPAIRAIGVAAGAMWRVAGAVFGRILPVVRPIVAFIAGRFVGSWRTVATVVRAAFSRVAGIVQTVGRAILGGVRSVTGGIGRAFSTVARVVVNPVRRAFGGAVDFISGIVGRAKDAAGKVVRGIVDVFKGIGGKVEHAVAGIARTIKDIMNAVIDVVNHGIRLINKATPGEIKVLGQTVVPSVPDIPEIPKLRRGGQVRRFQGGGLVALSPGELLVDPLGQRAMVPGRFVAADSVLASVPDRTRVFTGHGQGLLAAGASYDQALASQLPHFQEGGIAGLNKRFPRHGLADREGKFQMSERGIRMVLENAGGMMTPFRAAVLAKIFRQRESLGYPGIVSSDGGYGLGQATPRTWPAGSPLLKTLSRLGGVLEMLNPVKNGKMVERLAYWAQREAGNFLQPWAASSTPGFAKTVRRGVGSVLGGSKGGGKGRLTSGGRLPSATSAFAGGFQAGLEGTSLWDSDIVRSIVGAGRFSRQQRQQRAARGSGGVGGRRAYPFGSAAKLIGTPYSGTHTLGNWQSDNAIDLGIPMGTPTRAVISGKVGRISGGWGGGSSRFDGYQVYLAGSGDEWWYTHLQRAGVRSGQPVKAGQRLGISGAANGVPHLHLSRRPPRDPRDVLKWPRARGGGMVNFRNGGVTAGRGRPFTDATDDPRGHLPGSLDKFAKAVEQGVRRGMEHVRRGSPRADLGSRINEVLALPTVGPKGNEGFHDLLKRWTNRITALDETSKLFVEDQIAQLEQTLAGVRERIRQLRRGGVTRRERPQLQRLRGQVGDLPDQISELRSSLTPTYGWQRLQRFEGRLGRSVSRLQRGGEDRQQRVQIRRLQAMQRVVQAELGRRLGSMVLRADQQIEGFGRSETRFGQNLRAGGIDETSGLGIGMRRDFLQQQVNAMNRVKARLQTAFRRAVRRRDRAAVSEIQGRLGSLEDLIAESFTQLVEAQREQPSFQLSNPEIEMRAALAALTPDTADDKSVAQERVTDAQNRLRWVQAAGASPEVITEAAQNLKAAMDALAEGAESTSDLAEATRALTDEMKRTNDLTDSVNAIGLREAQRVLADLLSGQIQGELSQRARSSGDGMTMARY